MFQHIVIGRDKSEVVKKYSKSNNKYKQDEIIQMLDFLIDNIFALFSGWVFQQAIGIYMYVRVDIYMYVRVDIYMYVRYEFRVVRSVTTSA